MKLSDFKDIFNSIMRNFSKEERNDILSLIIEHIRDKDNENEVIYEKLNTLIELFQCYPLIVKKDKNKSTNIYYILNANKTPDFHVKL